MDEFYRCKYAIDDIERQEALLVVHKAKEIQRVERWAESYFTTEKFSSLIDQSKLKGARGAWMVKDIEIYMEKFARGEFTYTDIEKLVSYEANLSNFQSSNNYTDHFTKISKLFFGGDNE